MSSESDVLKRIYESHVKIHGGNPSWKFIPSEFQSDEEEKTIGKLFNKPFRFRGSYLEVLKDDIVSKDGIMNTIQLENDNFGLLCAFGTVLANTHYFARGPMKIPSTLFIIASSNDVDIEKTRTIIKKIKVSGRKFARVCLLLKDDITLRNFWLIPEPSSGDIFGYGFSGRSEDKGISKLIVGELFGKKRPIIMKSPAYFSGTAEPGEFLLRILEMSLVDNKKLIEKLIDKKQKPLGLENPQLWLIHALIIAGISPWVGNRDNQNVVPLEPISPIVYNEVIQLIN